MEDTEYGLGAHSVSRFKPTDHNGHAGCYQTDDSRIESFNDEPYQYNDWDEVKKILLQNLPGLFPFVVLRDRTHAFDH